jgi:hypothetical protein
MAMPWTRAKEKQRLIEADATEQKRLTALFDACFRIQREACEAAGRHIPLVVENVRGAQKWVGRSRCNFGSFHLWGDVPALMPMTKAIKVPSFRFDGSGKSFQSASVEHTGIKQGGDWLNASQPSISRQSSSKSKARKRASALIAKIPMPLARHIAACWKPADPTPT